MNQTEDYFNFLIYQIQAHLVKIDELKTTNKDLKSTITDLNILTKVLAKQHKITDQDINHRLKEIKDNIVELEK